MAAKRCPTNTVLSRVPGLCAATATRHLVKVTDGLSADGEYPDAYAFDNFALERIIVVTRPLTGRVPSADGDEGLLAAEGEVIFRSILRTDRTVRIKVELTILSKGGVVISRKCRIIDINPDLSAQL